MLLRFPLSVELSLRAEFYSVAFDWVFRCFLVMPHFFIFCLLPNQQQKPLRCQFSKHLYDVVLRVASLGSALLSGGGPTACLLNNRYRCDYSFHFFFFFPVMCSSQHELAFFLFFPAACAVHFTFRLKVLNVLPQSLQKLLNRNLQTQASSSCS